MPHHATPALFECHALTKRFGEYTAVNDLSFAIAPGECLGVIGPNGAGKTTTIRMCLGLTAPDEGQVSAFGLEMPRDALAIKARLGVVSQFDTLDPDLSPRRMKSYKSTLATGLPSRTSCTSRMEPKALGPPVSNSALIKVEKPATLCAPGTLA